MSEKKTIRYLSLAAKAGKLIAGGDDCGKAVRKHRQGGLLILASDAGKDAARRAEIMAETASVTVFHTAYTKSELASAVGRGSPVALALVTDEGLAAAFTEAANGMEQEEQI